MNKPDDQPEKMNLKSMDVAAEKRDELKRCLGQALPEAFAEGKIDFDQLKRVLGEWVDPGKERFGLNWPGKAECMKIIQQPSAATLKPVRAESVDFDTTDNLFIEGDNLEVLKLLQKAYFGKVKLIYIDPPYNTGNEFIYQDKYSESLDTYLAYTNQVDEQSRKFATNTEASGRFHSRWLNMMYPRLYLARNLLKEDGIILISIDDAEVENLRHICGEIFGEENLIANMVWEKGRKNDAKLVSVGHEYLLVYARSLDKLKELKAVWREEKPGAREIWTEYLQLREKFVTDDQRIEQEIAHWFQNLPRTHPAKKWARYRRIDKNGPWRDQDISWPGGGGPRYDVIHPKTKQPCKVPERGWIYSTSQKMQEMIALGVVEFREDHSEPPFRKAHIRPISYELEAQGDDEESSSDDEMATQVRGSYFYKQSQVSVKYLRELMGAKLFDNPKDHEELAKLIWYMVGRSNSEIVLDFFGGSGTTAEAVLRLNRDHGTKHRFVVVQLPEPVNSKEKSGQAALNAGFSTIADLARERIRRAANAIKKENDGKLAFEDSSAKDLGFKAFALAPSNFKVWKGDTGQFDASGGQLDLHIDHLDPSASPEDILYELVIKAGFSLDTPIEKRTLAGKEVFSIQEGSLFVCLDKEITSELVDAIAESNPLQVICLDEGFKGNDQLKANAVQTFKSRSESKESEIVFHTV